MGNRKDQKSQALIKSALKSEDLLAHHKELGGQWKLMEEHHIEKTYLFKSFKEALDFVNDVGRIAEEENHHPDVHLSYGKVELKVFTHSLKGLTEKDFELAAKWDACYLSKFSN